MAKIINLNSFLGEKTAIELQGETYEIDDSFPAVLKIDAMFKDDSVSSLEAFEPFFKIAFGDKKGAAFMKKGYSMRIYKKAMDVVQTALTGSMDDDEAEAPTDEERHTEKQ
jgi:hypothetical protein